MEIATPAPTSQVMDPSRNRISTKKDSWRLTRIWGVRATALVSNQSVLFCWRDGVMTGQEISLEEGDVYRSGIPFLPTELASRGMFCQKFAPEGHSQQWSRL